VKDLSRNVGGFTGEEEAEEGEPEEGREELEAVGFGISRSSNKMIHITYGQVTGGLVSSHYRNCPNPKHISSTTETFLSSFPLPLSLRGVRPPLVALQSVVIHPLQGQVARSSFLRNLIQILMLPQSLEDGADHGVGLSSANNFTGAADDSHALEDGTGEGTGDHGSLFGCGTNINPAVIFFSNQIMSQGGILVEVEEDQIVQGSSDRKREG
jgi:hypothetical protein